MSTEAGFQLHRIRISSSAIAEVVDKMALVSIPRADVRKLRIQRGVIAERPGVLVLFGLAATAIGAFSVAGLAHTLSNIPALGTALVVAGPLAILSALRRGVVLLVDTTRSTRKLGFGAKLGHDELTGFVDAARAAGLDVEVNLEVPRTTLIKTRPDAPEASAGER